MDATPRFAADVMLGSLARWLRVLGVDVRYDSSIDDPELVELAVAEGRTILTRDRRLVERRLARDHILIESDEIDEQLLQVAREASLPLDSQRLFGRCVDCNSAFEEIDSEIARQRVPPYVARTQEEFRYCPACDRVFWRATHVAAMEVRLRRLGLL
jgi:uncharacterized protein with PIN domain